MKPSEVGPGVFRLVLPLWGPELEDVNVWAIRSADGWRLIDAGYDSPEAYAAFVEQLAAIDAKPQEVREVFITHLHRDHFGLAARLASTARVVVLGDPSTGRPIDQRDGGARDGRAWLTSHGFEIGDMPGPPPPQAGGYHAPDAVVADGTILAWGEHRFEVVATPGHSRGHACLYEAASGLLASGDHVLERISSHVGGFNDDGPDMLGLYMSSLERVGRLPVKRVLPGHGPAFDRLAERVTELQEHHMVRTGEALAAFKGRPLPALEVASQISWLDQRDGWDRLGRTSRMMALSETVAHLRHLEATGQVISTRDGSGLLLYRRA